MSGANQILYVEKVFPSRNKIFKIKRMKNLQKVTYTLHEVFVNAVWAWVFFGLECLDVE